LNAALPALLMGIGRLGYRGIITERALSSLVAYVEEFGLEEILQWIDEDPGFLFVPSWQFTPWLSCPRLCSRRSP
jgi:hypothetical protein